MKDISKSSSSTLSYLSEIRVQRQPKTTDEYAANTLVQYREGNTIFENSLIEGTTIKERIIHVNETRRDKYQATVTHPTTSLGVPVIFSEEDAYFVYFPYNDALVMTIHIGC